MNKDYHLDYPSDVRKVRGSSHVVNCMAPRSSKKKTVYSLLIRPFYAFSLVFC